MNGIVEIDIIIFFNKVGVYHILKCHKVRIALVKFYSLNIFSFYSAGTHAV